MIEGQDYQWQYRPKSDYVPEMWFCCPSIKYVNRNVILGRIQKEENGKFRASILDTVKNNGELATRGLFETYEKAKEEIDQKLESSNISSKLIRRKI